MEKQRLFSGIQPSGNLHVGNYLGAIAQWLPLQDEYEAIFCIVDQHAITVPQDPAALRQKTLEIAKIYLAAGIDPKKCTLFIQSQVPEHTELMWILNTIARLGDLEKMTQFKDKSAKDTRETTGVGLFDYPVLMAADILLYDTAVVPVGEDQLQHIELTRTLARRFNERFGETFRVPEGKITKEGARIMALDDPTKKMSKSASSEYNFIALTDDADTIRRKIKKAVTDSGSEIVYSDEKPALKNLLNVYALFSGKTPQDIAAGYQGKGYGDFKTDLAEVVIGFLLPFQERLAQISDEEALVVLREGAIKARVLASTKMLLVRERVGFIGF
ncbi:MAG: tryptophan--tRNA ligase [Candidatus Moranbacteria bacterium]|nr:tryptophan--tRNA ligase [Candidatus Moranbacteria bacterium]MBP9801479.1 tryptophan--tRNA ligase [Candidatus Moranbacteria bacterium]